MKAEFNEREYETCFLAEFLRKYQKQVVSPPMIPTLLEENRLGYDVELKLKSNKRVKSIFIQFKVPIYSDRWHVFLGRGGHYKFKITRLSRSQQHNLLVNLGRKGESVFYNSTLFHRRSDLVRYFSGDQIIYNSRFFNPIEIGIINDNEQHNVAYDIQGARACFQSEPKEITISSDFQGAIDSSREIDKEYIGRLFLDLMECFKEVNKYGISLPDKIREEKDDLPKIKYVLNKIYNLTWLLIEV